MLASHLSQLAQHASSLTREEMSASVNAGLILLSGSLSTLRDGEDDGPARQVVRNGMRRLVREHIERHLDAGHLSPETIAAALGISRSSLYRLFLRDGGVNAYIQGRRLDRCFDELLLAPAATSASRSLPTATASSESAFSRAFRLRFGASPSEVRAHARGSGDGEPVDIRSREDAVMIQAWLADIRQPAAAAASAARRNAGHRPARTPALYGSRSWRIVSHLQPTRTHSCVVWRMTSNLLHVYPSSAGKRAGNNPRCRTQPVHGPGALPSIALFPP